MDIVESQIMSTALGSSMSGIFAVSYNNRPVSEMSENVVCILHVGMPRLLTAPQVDTVTMEEMTVSWRSWKRHLDVGDPDVSSYE